MSSTPELDNLTTNLTTPKYCAHGEITADVAYGGQRGQSLLVTVHPNFALTEDQRLATVQLAKSFTIIGEHGIIFYPNGEFEIRFASRSDERARLINANQFLMYLAEKLSKPLRQTTGSGERPDKRDAMRRTVGHRR